MRFYPKSLLRPWVQRTTLAALLGVASCGLAQAQLARIAGSSRVIDGDTVVIGSVHIRLRGLDAPEIGDLGGSEARLRRCAPSSATTASPADRTAPRPTGALLRPAP